MAGSFGLAEFAAVGVKKRDEKTRSVMLVCSIANSCRLFVDVCSRSACFVLRFS